ncbi:MAG: type VI secretion system tube protein Hcp [Polyangiaceae bacterium]|jgi:type VI secretion system Hcp family effector
MSTRHAVAFMHVKGSSQGGFLDDGTRAGSGRTLCHSVRFRGDVPHDVRGGSHHVTKHEPISVVHEWGPATVQFLSALWSNEVLDEVGFEFMRADGHGKEVVYATLTLTKATVAYVELRSGGQSAGAEAGQPGGAGEAEVGEWLAHDDVGLHAEKIEFTIKSGSGNVTATYDRSKS